MMGKRPGRPRLDARDPSVPVTVSIPSKQLAAATAEAKAARLTLQAWIRRTLRAATVGRLDQ